MSRAAWALLVVGLAQMAGDLSGVKALKGLGAATLASPAPKVFSAVNGYETYSTRFFIEWPTADGRYEAVEITSERYADVVGPYNRRNIFGAALSYGPVLPPSLRDPVIRYALCGDGPLLRELGITNAPRSGLRVRYEPRPGIPVAPVPLLIEAPCKRR